MDFMDVLIVGGGPAGAYCAHELAKQGFKPAIFDHSHPREKPCGGGISQLTVQKFPFLEQLRSQGSSPETLKLISCTNSTTTIGEQKGFNISRQVLDKKILQMATDQGAKYFKEKVLAVQKHPSFWLVKTDKRLLKTKILVGADGVNSLVRKKTVGAISSKNLALTYGYIATGTENEASTIKFMAEIPGYIWILPRGSNSSIGVGSELQYGSRLKHLLFNFMRSDCPQIEIGSIFSALLPSVTEPDFFNLPASGDDWVLVGDAAGHVDPLTGGGILYALWSGKLAAQAIAENNLRLYDKLWQKEYGGYFRERCKQRSAFYDPFLIEVSIVSNAFKNGFLSYRQTIV
jgi:geranylgeranyl reductase family protein